MGRRTGSESGRCCQRCGAGRGGKPWSGTNLFPLPRQKPGALPGALGHGRAIGLGKAPGHGLSSEWPGGGDLDGTQKGHTEGPPRAQKGETVPEEPLPAFPAVNSL